MKILILGLMFLSIFLAACGVSDVGGNSKNIESIKSESITKSNQTHDDVLIEFAKEVNKKYINNLENTLQVKPVKLSEVGDCGGFFSENDEDVESIWILDHVGINIMNNKAMITSVVDIPDNYNIKYNNIIINNKFKIKSFSIKNYEVFSEKSNYNQKFIINGSEYEVIYNDFYIIRERLSDNLLHAYYLNKKLVALQLISQC